MNVENIAKDIEAACNNISKVKHSELNFLRSGYEIIVETRVDYDEANTWRNVLEQYRDVAEHVKTKYNQRVKADYLHQVDMSTGKHYYKIELRGVLK